ncbi:hypothetical protein BBD41_28220 [Paenibacillus ihbetae]|uniref:DUF4367 domain-containing protein n=1 Tax=Paenibacillus ihbetae TaxID=1870820 RepID=A0A1B2E870_9BACL|nr:hypothetical protein [Paenibacillus ihbetae]ANY76149.1 hypothetical protein BBD41_28220 [Paenibacillus ihbetae]
MSIEQQLKDEFQHNAKNVVCPPSIDMRVMSAYKEQVKEKKGDQPMERRRRWPKAVMVILMIAVVSGFAYAGRTLLFEDTRGNMTMSAITLEELKLSKSQLERISQARNEVKAQLNPGESAVVYLTDLGNVRSLPFIPVSQPDVNEDLDAWRKALKERHFDRMPPDSILGTYRFAGGMELSPFGTYMGSETDSAALLEELKAEIEETGQDYIWRKTPAPASLPLLTYTTVYRNADHATLYLIMENAPDSRVKIQLLAPPSAEHEELDLNGHAAHYFKNDSYVYTDSHFYQEISWMIEQGGKSVIYRLGSDSPAMSKEQLVEAAKNL